MKIPQLIVVFIISSMVMTSCVSTKKFNEQGGELLKTKNDLNDCQTQLAKGQVSNKKLNDQIKDLQTQADSNKVLLDAAAAKLAADNGGQILNTLKDLNIINPDQVQSINSSLTSLNGQSKDALNSALVNNLKVAIGAENDTDINVISNNGKIFIDISDNMYFSTGSAELSARAKAVIAKIAKILNAHPDMSFMVEGHTDNKPIHGGGCTPDNWDLSVRRATAVVKLLQKEYKVDPARMIAAGHSEYEPVQANDTPDHRAKNRRISIIMTPQLDQFFKLLGN
jgi:chemotaxis protein MotB